MSFSAAVIINSLRDFFSNSIIVSSLLGWFLSQLTKGIIALARMREKGSKEILKTFFWHTGGMPSSHAAVVASMTAAVAFSQGMNSNLFGVSLFVAFVIMRDAMGVRRAVGIQAFAYNNLGRKIAEKLSIDFLPIKEIQGHAPLEVILGALLGVLVSAAYAFL
jgi:acid phosphatase family membrane protein YuiD